MTDPNVTINELRTELAIAKRDFSDLKTKLDETEKTLERRTADAARMLEWFHQIKKRPSGYQPEVILLTVAALCGARLGYFAQIEDWGRLAKDEGRIVNLAFATIVGLLLAIWLIHEGRVSGWACVVKGAIAAVGFRIAVNEWMLGQAVNATVIGIAVSIALALPYVGSGLQLAVLYLQNPRLIRR